MGQEEEEAEKKPAQKKHKVIVKRKKKKPVQSTKKPAAPVDQEPAMSKTGDIELPTFPQSRLKASAIEAEDESSKHLGPLLFEAIY